MLKLVVGFLLGIMAALGGPALAADNSDLTSTCHTWKDKRTQQCNVTFQNPSHFRIKIYDENGWYMTFDWWPDNFDRSSRRQETD